MVALDWIILVILVPILIYPAVSIRRGRAARATDRFAAGKKSSWFILGGSIAATSLSTDTPLLVAGAFYADGAAGNWFWLARVPGTLATLFFFSRYWLRSGVLTEPELLALRYGPSLSTRWLRVFLAVFDGAIINVLVLASVTFAAKLLIVNMLSVSAEPLISVGVAHLSPADFAIIVMVAVTACYTMIAGFDAVIRTDLAQLAAAILASVVIAIFAIAHGMSDLGGIRPIIDAIPDKDTLFDPFSNIDSSLVLLLAFTWWQTAPGGGLLVQRFVSARSERDATLTTLWFAIIHYVIRAWPWFLIGAFALIYFPGLTDSELAYPLVAERFLPTGGIGLICVAFWSAYASTLDSRLNWGASYFVNDVYGACGFDRDGRGARIVEYTAITVISVLVLITALSSTITSLINVYKYLIVIQAGAAFAAIARWYWWRMNQWAEIAALVASLVCGNVLLSVFSFSLDGSFAEVLGINSIVCATITALIAVLTTQKGSRVAREAFYEKTQVTGPGWRPFRSNNRTEARNRMGWAAIYWLLTTLLVYALIGLISSIVALKLLSLIIYFILTVSIGCALRFRWSDLIKTLKY